MNATPLPGFSSPSASTEAPLEMLAACHGRVEHQCQTLERLSQHLPRHGCDQAAREAAVAVMRYFDTAALDHHADEEVDLFPALLAAATPLEPGLPALVEQLRAEHRQLETAWQTLKPHLQAIAQGTSHVLDPQAVTRLINAYRQHIATEDTQLLPTATRCLPNDALLLIGQAMRERRGIAAID